MTGSRPAVRPARPFFSSGPCAKRPGCTPEALSGALLGRWPDLGASLVSKPVRVDYISGVGHFGIFGDARAARLLMHPFS